MLCRTLLYGLLFTFVLVSETRGEAFLYEANNQSDTLQLRLLMEQGKELVYQYPDSALHNFINAIEIAEQLNLPVKVAANKNWAGVAHYILGEYDRALLYFTEALRLYEKVGDDYGLATSYNHMGLIYQIQHEYVKAISVHKKGIWHAQKINNVDRMASNNFNIGLAFDESKHYDSALYYLNLSLNQSQSIDLHRVYIMSLNRLAKVYYHSGDYARAEALYNDALNYTAYTNNWEKCFSWAGLAEVYEAKGEYQKGVSVGKKSFELAQKINARWDIIHVGVILSRLLAHEKNHEEAYRVLNRTYAYRDSVFNEEKENSLNYIHLRENELEKEQLEQQNATQALQLRQRTGLIIVIAIVFLSVITVMIVVYFYQRQKLILSRKLVAANLKMEEQNRYLSELNETKNRLFSIISHDMRAPFNSLHAMLELMRTNNLAEDQQDQMLAKLSSTVQSVSGTLDNLLQWSQSQLDGIRTHPELFSIDELLTQNIRFWQTAVQAKDLTVKFLPNGYYGYADRYQLKIVLRNILGNAIKFTPPSGVITIATVQESDRIGIVIEDSGIGMPPEMLKDLFMFQKENQRDGTSQEKGTGLGLMISDQLIKKNKGVISVQSEQGKGSAFTIWIPAKE